MVRLEAVVKNYDRFRLECSMEVKPGHITGLIGANGAGKSTTFKSILGLISIDSGSVKVFGRDVNKLTNEDKDKIGVVLSKGSFSEWFTLKNINGIMKALHKNYDEEYVHNMCRRFELPMDVKIKEFSSGMKTRLNIILAMSYGASLLILDEPTLGLDVIARNDLLDLMREYMDGGERSILISSHISSDLESLCDDLYMIHDGSIIFHEDTDVLTGEYGVIKVTAKQYEKLEPKYISYVLSNSMGYECVTSKRQFYIDNYPDIVIEKGNIDSFLSIVEKGERV